MANEQYRVLQPWTTKHGQQKPSFTKGATITAADAEADGADIDNLLYIGVVELIEPAAAPAQDQAAKTAPATPSTAAPAAAQASGTSS